MPELSPLFHLSENCKMYYITCIIRNKWGWWLKPNYYPYQFIKTVMKTCKWEFYFHYRHENYLQTYNFRYIIHYVIFNPSKQYSRTINHEKERFPDVYCSGVWISSMHFNSFSMFDHHKEKDRERPQTEKQGRRTAGPCIQWNHAVIIVNLEKNNVWKILFINSFISIFQSGN